MKSFSSIHNIEKLKLNNIGLRSKKKWDTKQQTVLLFVVNLKK